MGVNEQIIFPEIEYDKIDKLRGLDIAVTTTARTDDEGRALLTALRFPFRGVTAGVEEKTEAKEEFKEVESPETNQDPEPDREET
jgi:hypothetical protein